MLYKIFEIEDFIDNKNDSEKEIIKLMENNNSYLKLVFLKKHQTIEPHMAHTNVCLYITKGEIEIKFHDDDNCTCQSCGCDIPIEEDDNGRKYKIKEEQLFFFEKDVTHSIKALKDSSFLLIKI